MAPIVHAEARSGTRGALGAMLARRGVRNATFCKCLVGIAAAAAQKAHNTTKGKVVRGGKRLLYFAPDLKWLELVLKSGEKAREGEDE